MYHYVMLDDNQVVTAVASTQEVVFVANSRAIDRYDPSLMGHRWTGTGWEEVPRPATPLSQLAFLRRFTADERMAIRASNDPVVVDFLHLLSLAQDVRLADADTLAGVGYLEQAGLLVAGRAAEILAG